MLTGREIIITVMNVSLYDRMHISETTCPSYTKFFLHVVAQLSSYSILIRYIILLLWMR